MSAGPVTLLDTPGSVLGYVSDGFQNPLRVFPDVVKFCHSKFLSSKLQLQNRCKDVVPQIVWGKPEQKRID